MSQQLMHFEVKRNYYRSVSGPGGLLSATQQNYKLKLVGSLFIAA